MTLTQQASNQAPQFKEDIIRTIIITRANLSAPYTYQSPQATDPENDKISFKLNGADKIPCGCVELLDNLDGSF